MIDDGINLMRDFGLTGMVVYAVSSALFTALAIPLQFLDLCLGIVYPVHEAALILIISKMLGAAMTFYAANYLIKEETKKSYMSSKYLKGLQEVVRREPFKYGLLLRFASIPVVIRNYGLAVLPINFSTFMMVTFIQCSITSPFQAFTASHFQSFMEFTSQNQSEDALLNTPRFDDEGNMIIDQQPPITAQKASKLSGGSLGIMVLGIVASLYVAHKIKKTVDELNSKAEAEEAARAESKKSK